MRKSPFAALLVLGVSILIFLPTTARGQIPGFQTNQGDKAETREKIGHTSWLRLLNPPHGFFLLPRPDQGTGNGCLGGAWPKGLPSWFKDLDNKEEGQVSLAQWRATGKKLAEFREYDLNDDGFITAEEVLRYLQRPVELKFENGQANFTGAIEAVDEKYRGKKCFKIFTIKLEQGKTYQIDHMSKAFDAYLILEDSDGELLADDDDGGEGLNSRIVHRADRHGICRVVATGVGSGRPGAFSFSVRVIRQSGVLPKGLPRWFKDLDKDEDGQVALHEWRAGGKKLSEFRDFDRNDDGFITADELLRFVKTPFELKLESGLANYSATIEEPADEKYRGKKSFKILKIKLEAGKTYQFDLISKMFQAFIYLEDADGDVLKENSARNIGENSRLVFRADRSGTYRLIATSLGGFRTGPFLFSVRTVGRAAGTLPKGVPSWFKDFDKDEDGQLALQEWRASGKKPGEFREVDRNDDGFITPEEVLHFLKTPYQLKLENGRVNYSGALDEAEEMVRDKKSFKIFTIKMEAGKTYQIDYLSQAYYAYLYLEDSEGNLLEKHNSGGKGLNSRIIHYAAKTATYRVMATSQDGHKTGDYAISVRTAAD